MMASERALLRIREEMAERHLSQRDLAERLACSQSRVAKILGGGVNLRLNDLAALAEAVGVSLCEAVRDRGLEFYAEMSPLELRILQRLRQRPETMTALMTLLDVRDVTKIGKPGPKVGRPLDSSRRK